MYSKKTALQHLYLVAGCLLVADLLPRWQESWFVAESGNFSTSIIVSLVLVLGLFKRWRNAFNLMLGWLILRLCFSAIVLYNNLDNDDPIVGHLLTNTLNLAALGILCCSSDLKRYLNDRPQNLTQQPEPTNAKAAGRSDQAAF
ncbi:hypothetical protein GCM10011375_06330 [Hymenobacter qilianensis]|uniref:Uncharacterized protein n=2 Tax=Hymenobacter qilianensis TaxID=1385715 RepID=A0A7H0GZK7_9BACT|nr:hypothetical protein [Hymenobacter qilianensis]QNP53723.1 hypothetical protein H9L05_09375 [Hymenobacter qilianensis]GGF53531.1 hypothetical protein GCM10011375_06330 [Hymenobacter qilianensis]